jgi:hypothetical protein
MVARQISERVGALNPCVRKTTGGFRQLRIGKKYLNKRSDRGIPRIVEPIPLGAC